MIYDHPVLNPSFVCLVRYPDYLQPTPAFQSSTTTPGGLFTRRDHAAWKTTNQSLGLTTPGGLFTRQFGGTWKTTSLVTGRRGFPDISNNVVVPNMEHTGTRAGSLASIINRGMVSHVKLKSEFNCRDRLNSRYVFRSCVFFADVYILKTYIVHFAFRIDILVVYNVQKQTYDNMFNSKF